MNFHVLFNTRTTTISTIRFESQEASKDIDENATVEEIVMEGNPKAPKFQVEHHVEPPRDAYVEHVII